MGKVVEKWIDELQVPKITDGPHRPVEGYGVDHKWTKKSIFWELPYWKHNRLRHNLDVMHIEKNFFDNLINTVMDVPGKTKDNEKARADLPRFCSRKKMEMKTDANGRKWKPKASYTLTEEQNRKVCDWVSQLRLPDGFSSNFANCVDRESGAYLVNFKSHDCHVFLENLVPIAFNGGVHISVWKLLTEISLFFKQICSSTLREEDLKRMEENVPIILCKMEAIFPPAFFDVMEHLVVHLVDEAILGGPCQYRWMYPFERNIGKTKRSVTNRFRIEGSICEAYLARETSHFCSYYFDPGVGGSLARGGRNDDGGDSAPTTLAVFNQPGRGVGRSRTRYLSDKEYESAALHVLLNSPEIEATVRDYTAYYGEDSVNPNFRMWFYKWVFDENNGIVNPYIRDLAFGPHTRVKIFDTYIVNGYKFSTESKSKTGRTVNSGVWIKGHKGEGDDYHGVLQEVIELTYGGEVPKTVVLFNCKWYDPTVPGGTRRVHSDFDLLEIHKKRFYALYDPFVIAQNAKQVYYCTYPLRPKDYPWLAVVRTKAQGRIEAVEGESGIDVVDINDELDLAFQNDHSSNVDLSVDNELPLIDGDGTYLPIQVAFDHRIAETRGEDEFGDGNVNLSSSDEERVYSGSEGEN